MSTARPGGATAELTTAASTEAAVELLWIPLGAGGRSVAWNGRTFERLAARRGGRARRDLYHSALQVHLGTERYVIEMGPAWGSASADRGVTGVGPVGSRWLGGLKAFRYEVRRWQDGTIPDAGAAVGGAHVLARDPHRAQLVLDLVPDFPLGTWGRDEQSAGGMWNSNSLTAWLLVRSGCDLSAAAPPPDGRAPGWDAGVVVAARLGVVGDSRVRGAPPDTPGCTRA